MRFGREREGGQVERTGLLGLALALDHIRVDEIAYNFVVVASDLIRGQ